MDGLPRDAFASVLKQLGPPWRTQQQGEAASPISALREASRSLRAAVDNSDYYWTLATASACGGSALVVDSHSLPLQRWKAYRDTSLQWRYLPTRSCLWRTPVPTDSLPTAAPLPYPTAPTVLRLGAPCQIHGNRSTVSASCLGRRIVWTYWDACGDDVQFYDTQSTQQGHTGPIFALQPITPPSTHTHTLPYLWASASADHTVKLWSLRPTTTTHSHTQPCSLVAQPSQRARDSTRTMQHGLAGVGDDLDTAMDAVPSPEDVAACCVTVRPVRTLRHHSEAVTCLEVLARTTHSDSAEQVLLASGSADRTICIVKLNPQTGASSNTGSSGNTGSKVSVLRGHEKPVTCLTAAVGRLASGGTDCRVRLWELAAATGTNTSGGMAGGWKVDEPVRQLVWYSPTDNSNSRSTATVSTASAAIEAVDDSSSGVGSSFLVAVQGERLTVIDVREPRPVWSVRHPSRCRASWQTAQAVCVDNLLACTRGDSVAVFDLRMLSPSALHSSTSGSLTHTSHSQRPLHEWTPALRHPLTHLYMDRHKVVATALPAPQPAPKPSHATKPSSRTRTHTAASKPHTTHQPRNAHSGTVFCWDVRSGQLLRSFRPTNTPCVARTHAAESSTAGYRQRAWPPDLSAMQVRPTSTRPHASTQPATGSGGLAGPSTYDSARDGDTHNMTHAQRRPIARAHDTSASGSKDLHGSLCEAQSDTESDSGSIESESTDSKSENATVQKSDIAASAAEPVSTVLHGFAVCGTACVAVTNETVASSGTHGAGGVEARSQQVLSLHVLDFDTCVCDTDDTEGGGSDGAESDSEASGKFWQN